MFNSTRRTASLLTVAGLSAVLAACGQSAAQDVPAVPAAAAYDITGIDALAGEFPVGFEVQAGLTKTLGADDVERAGHHAVTQAELSPAHCLPMILPAYAHPAVGAEAAGVTASGVAGGVQVTAMRLPVAVPADAAPVGCDRVTVAGPDTHGVAERVTSPAIDGVTTTAVKLVADGQAEAHYLYTAALDSRTVVVVRSSLDDTLNPPQFMSGLLVKAVNAVKGVATDNR